MALIRKRNLLLFGSSLLLLFWFWQGLEPPQEIHVVKERAPTPQCNVLVNFASEEVVRDPNNHDNCSLFKVIEHHGNSFQPLPGASGTFALLKAAHHWNYVVQFKFGLVTALAYSQLHNYQLFLYVVPQLAARRKRNWISTFQPKHDGMAALHSYLDVHRSSEHAIWYTDLDGWFDLKPDETRSLDSLVSRVRQHRRSADFSLLLQGELEWCSCAFVLWRDSFGKSWWDHVEQTCLMVPNAGKPLCDNHAGPYDQIGFQRLILHTLNNSNNFQAPHDSCFSRDGHCQSKIFMSSGDAEVASMPWPHIAFVPQTGTTDFPQFVSCQNQWRNCDNNPALFLHIGHRQWTSKNPLLAQAQQEFRSTFNKTTDKRKNFQ